MRALIAILVLAAVASALTEKQLFEDFKERYNRAYTASEEERRFEVFSTNLRRAERLNRRGGAKFGVTMFSDLSSDEFVARLGHLDSIENTSLPNFPHTVKHNALGTDWIAQGLVTSIKDQGSCGSCWAFSATGAAEGCYAIKNKKTLDLSVQQIIDCCDLDGCDGGCNGGFEYTALEWAMTVDLTTQAKYKYVAKKQTCKKITEVALPAGTCDFYKTAKSEAAAVSALEHGLVTIALDATELQLYTSGVISGSQCSGTSLNHALLLVSDEGEGTSYVVKNSWGTSWGEDGFFRMIKNKGCLGITGDAHSVAY